MGKTLYFSRINPGLEWRTEDTNFVSNKYPIFCIADGVTIPEYLEKKSPTYPRIIADIFCRKTVDFLEGKYPEISEREVWNAYNYASSFIKDFYKKNSTKHERGITGCVVIKKEGFVIGSRFLDSGFAVLRAGKIVFKTPEFWKWHKENRPNEKCLYINILEDLSNFVQVYNIEYKEGDLLILYTDGFERHFNLEDFLNVFDSDGFDLIEEKLNEIDKKLSQYSKDYSDERSLLLIRL